ncbi:MAG: hypothetical protein KDB03_27655 [Planctomycetales bacterium]|nr:hypothetical protein [Planctomycetales bacterium]
MFKSLFGRVLGKPILELDGNPLRAREFKRGRRRVVAKPDLVRLFQAFRPVDRLVPQLMYASVLRLSDTSNLRIKDLHFADEQIELANTKHDHFRIVATCEVNSRCSKEAGRFGRENSPS